MCYDPTLRCNTNTVYLLSPEPQPKVVERGLSSKKTNPTFSLLFKFLKQEFQFFSDAKTKDTTRTIPKCVSFAKKGSSKKPKLVEKGRAKAFLRSKGIPEFLLSEKRSLSASPLQVKVKLGTALQGIPDFLYSDKRHSSKDRILNIEELKQKEEGESEDGVVAEGFGPEKKFSHGNCDQKIKHAKVHEWGGVLSLAVGDGSFEVLSKTGQIDEDKNLDPIK